MTLKDVDVQLQKALRPVAKAWKGAMGPNLVSVVLFGSRARGEAKPDSDWDLFVVADGLPERITERSRFLLSFLPVNWRYWTAVIAKTTAEFESALPPLYLDIALDGIILHDSNGYMATKLAYISQRLAEMGLERRQQGQDWIWLWRTPPGKNWELEWKR